MAWHLLSGNSYVHGSSLRRGEIKSDCSTAGTNFQHTHFPVKLAKIGKEGNPNK